MKVIMNWSGGKDSALTLFKILQQPTYEVAFLLTSLSGVYNRISMHGVRTELLEQQARQLNIELVKLFLPENASMEIYNQKVIETLGPLIDKGVEASVFGDIFLEDLKAYREKQLALVNMKAVFPLWKRDTKKLANEFINRGFKTIITCVNNACLSPDFAGRVYDESFLNDLPDNVDPCGENGEFHSFVYDGPLFKNPIAFELGKKEKKTYPLSGDSAIKNEFTFIDLLPK